MTGTEQKNSANLWQRFLQNKYFPQILLTAVLLLLILILSTTSEYFLSWKNFRNILDQCAVYLILSIGMTFVIAGGGVDLSVGSTAGLCGVIMALLIKGGCPTGLAIGAGILAGVAIGTANGLFIAKIKINPFITTLSTMIIVRGIALVLTGGVSIYGFTQAFKWFGTGSVGPLNPPIIISLLLTVAGFILLNRTLWGKYCLALGGNGEALRRNGVNTTAYRISIYAVSGFCAGLAGLIMTARLNSAAPLAGSGYEMDAIAAVVLGVGCFNGGVGSVTGTFIASLTLAVIRNGLTMLAISTDYQQVVTGSIILLAIIAARLRSRKNRAEE